MAIRIKARSGESVEQMLRRFKKLCEKEGLTKDLKKKQNYEKPSERKRRDARVRPCTFFGDARLHHDCFRPPPLGHQHGAVGAHHQREGHHLVGGRHLEVQSRANGAAQAMHIVVLDVSTILSQMHGDAVGSEGLDITGYLKQIGIVPSARIAQGGEFIDVEIYDAGDYDLYGVPVSTKFVN